MIDTFGTAVPPPARTSTEYAGSPSSMPTVTPAANPRMWGILADGSMFHPVGETTQELPSGFYRFCEVHPVGLVAVKVPNETDLILQLPDSESERLLGEVHEFLTLRDKFKERGLLYKRGILLYGPPGSGKTATIQVLAQVVAEKLGSVAVLADHPVMCSQGLNMLRRLEPNRQLVVILEDMDALVMRHGEEGYLSLLDGENQVENVIYIATTNYPERLDRRFVDRPSRFDTIRLIGMPSVAARRAYLQHKEPDIQPGELEAMVAASEGYSIAHLRELLVLVKCFGRTIESATERLDGMREQQPSSERQFGALRAVGFGG
jgi:energy-coupling factor transporter ATP-binding protein EcfA2